MRLTPSTPFSGALAVLEDGRLTHECLADDPAGFSQAIHGLRRTHGGVLLRDLRFDDPAGVEAIARCLCAPSDLLQYDGERATPRTALGGFVYSSTEYEKSGTIFVHNECSSRLNWPLVLMFACGCAATSGGATPLCDMRVVTRRLDPGVRQRFRERGIQYTRNYGAEFGVSLEYAFGTQDKTCIEAYCTERQISAHWNADGSLTNRFCRPAHARHPETGEELWFNYATFYSRAALEPRLRRMLRGVPDSKLAFSAAYGDGEPVPLADFDACREAHDASTYRFDWRRGDLLLLDNMLSGHGRDPFEGSRQTYVVMAMDVARSSPKSLATALSARLEPA